MNCEKIQVSEIFGTNINKTHIYNSLLSSNDETIETRYNTDINSVKINPIMGCCLDKKIMK